MKRERKKTYSEEKANKENISRTEFSNEQKRINTDFKSRYFDTFRLFLYEKVCLKVQPRVVV
jgi:hypothetical protein